MKRLLLLAGVTVVSLFFFTSDVMAVDGWASENGGTTGGAGGTTVTVTTAADLETYAEAAAAYIIQVSGTIDITGLTKLGLTSNKTLIGVGTNPTIIGNVRFVSGSSNIIIQGLNITNPTDHDQGDGITVKDDITNLFITKCTIYDCADGCIDISNGSDYVTVSWCKFYYDTVTSHRFVNLIGSSDTRWDDRGKLRVTMHHNWWSTNCDQRMPRVRFGQVHVYNNYYSDLISGGYCHGVGVECQIRVENNYYDAVNNPWKDYSSAGIQGIIGWNGGNVFSGCSVPTWAPNDYATIFTPPYSYTLDTGTDVKSIVMAGAGNIGSDTTPPAAPTGLIASAGYAIVELDWNDNNEPDFEGYNVHRSTTSGNGYDKLNSTLLSSPIYDDNSVPHDTTYYYVVTAVDTNSNESGYSNEVFSGLYGDFTGNGIVDTNDLPDFLTLWLESNCGLTAGVDLDDDCLINFYEFSVLGNNWRK